MSHGLRIWDASGKLRLDITDRFPKLFAYFYVTIDSATSTTLQIPGFTPGDFLIDSDFKVSAVGDGYVTVYSYLTSPRSGNVFIFKG